MERSGSKLSNTSSSLSQTSSARDMGESLTGGEDGGGDAEGRLPCGQTTLTIIGVVAGMALGLLCRVTGEQTCEALVAADADACAAVTAVEEGETWAKKDCAAVMSAADPEAAACEYWDNSQVLEVIGFPGQLYINALMLFVVPYICASMFVGQRPDPTNSSAGIGKIAVTCYGITTVLASLEAVLWTHIFVPEPQAAIVAMVDDDKAAHVGVASDVEGKTVLDTALSIGGQLLPRNILDTYIHSNLLGIIVFFTLLGKSCCKRPGCERVFELAEIVQDSFMGVIIAVVGFTPLGIGCKTRRDTFSIWPLACDRSFSTKQYHSHSADRGRHGQAGGGRHRSVHQARRLLALRAPEPRNHADLRLQVHRRA